MPETSRLQARGWALPAFALPLVLALLALACVPVAAQADSVGAQYEDDLPVVPEKDPVKDKNGADKNNGGGGDARISDGETGGSGGAGGGNGGDGSGSGGGSAKENPSTGGNGDKVGVGSGKATPDGESSPGNTSSNTAKAEDDSSSSPLVPILIAIAVLAAASIGFVVIRRRRDDAEGDAGGAVSPKAG